MAFVPDALSSRPFTAGDEMDYLNTLLELEPLQEFCASVEPDFPRADVTPIHQGGYAAQPLGQAPGGDSASGCQTSMNQIYSVLEPIPRENTRTDFAKDYRGEASLPQFGARSVASSGAAQDEGPSEQLQLQEYKAPHMSTSRDVPILPSPNRSVAQYSCPLETQLKPPRIVNLKRKRPNADLYSHVLRKTVETQCTNKKQRLEINPALEHDKPGNKYLLPSQRREHSSGPNGKIYRQANTARFALRAKQAFVAQHAQRQTNDGSVRTLPSVNAATRAMERREREFEGADEEMETTRGNAVRLAKWAAWANYALEADEACLTLAR